MGTREVYEQKLQSGNLYHDPTINPGLGLARCPRCLSRINPNSESAEWRITTVLHDATAVAGTGAGAMLSAVHGVNSGIPFIQRHAGAPKWLQLAVGVPSLLLYSAGSAALGGYVVPKFAQLFVTTYYAASSASHYAISRVTGMVEEPYIRRQREKP
ncbi:hypothetical protein H6P81_008010 [Aristolochia fimbriata]|uniref:Transmembrane protein n=1 Tax=Aristolochia fimbriata TaxID=158543 RepID=A0AAV7F333_ARIFI|nr:hypothetical protein H6P81_008010 [Aristolochia fimbriata]